MAVTSVGAGSTADLSLSDGTNTLEFKLVDGRGRQNGLALIEQANPRTALRVAQGSGGYSDYELPYSPIVQSSWSGGRGNEDFERDTTRYYDGNAIDTSMGEIWLGPKAVKTNAASYTMIYDVPSIFDAGVQNIDLAPVWNGLPPSQTGIDHIFLIKYTPGSAITLTSIVFKIEQSSYVGNFNSYAKAVVYSNSGGTPGTLITAGAEVYIPWVQTSGGGMGGITLPLDPTQTAFPISTTLSMATTYWIGLQITNAHPTDGTQGSTVTIYGKTATGAKYGIFNTGPAWIYTDNIGPHFGYKTTEAREIKLFSYRGNVYALANSTTGGAPKLYMNGYHGMASSNSGTLNYLKTSITFSVNLAGGYAKIISGPGFAERQNWRKIFASGGTDAQVTPAWEITHTTSTEFAITGIDLWTEITSHGITKRVTDILVVDDIIYFCQGDDAAVQRGRWSAGSWTWTADGTDKRDFMKLYTGTDGKRKIIGVSAGTSLVYKADPVTSWTNLTWTAENSGLPCGSKNTKITGLCIYGDERLPYVFKEDEFGSIKNGIYARFPLNELASLSSEYNGRVAIQNNLYLYFTLGTGLERYFEGKLDDMGPNRDVGLPSDRQGPISALVGYPGGRLYAAVDAGPYGYSSVLLWNGEGWCELYRGSYGQRITDMILETVPGAEYQMLHVGEGSEVTRMMVAINPKRVEEYQYASSGSLTTSWMYGSYRDIVKYFKSIKVFAENLNNSGIDVTVSYQTDTATSWTTIGTDFTTSPKQEQNLSASNNTVGIRIRFNLALNSTIVNTSPLIKAVLVNAMTRVQPKRSWVVRVLLEDGGLDLQNEPRSRTALADYNQIRDWQNSDVRAAPLLMRTRIPTADNLYVCIEPGSVMPVDYIQDPDNQKLIAIGQFTLMET